MLEVVEDVGVRVGAAVALILVLVKLAVRVLVVKIHSQNSLFSLFNL